MKIFNLRIFTDKQWNALMEHQKETMRNALIKVGVENQDLMANHLLGTPEPRPDLVKDAHRIADDWTGYYFRD